jgi:hypothetical protein
VPADLARRPSVADRTREYIDQHPGIREALRQDIINFTALARKIQAEWEIPNEEAVTIACRRYQHELRGDPPGLAAVRQIVARSRLQVHTRVAMVRFHDDWEVVDRLLTTGRRMLADHPGRPLFQVFEGTVAGTVLCEESMLPSVLESIPQPHLIRVERNLATLAFRSHPEVAETPGVFAFMAEALFRGGINCRETVSVNTESTFVFREPDVIGAYQLLSALIPAEALRSARRPIVLKKGRERPRGRIALSATPR